MDWCRYYVISVAVDMRSFLEASLNNKPGLVEVYSYPPFETYTSYRLEKLNINKDSDLRYVGGVLKAMLDNGYLNRSESLKLRFNKAEDVSNLTYDKSLVDLPVKKGLASSAAISVVTAAAIDIALTKAADEKSVKDMLNSEENLTKYASLAYIAEKKILGINCGQMDQFSSAYGGLLFINCRPEPARVERLLSEAEIPLVIGDTGQNKDTPKILAWLEERFRRGEPEFIEGVRGIVDVVLRAKQELSKAKPDLYRVGELMNLNQHYLSKNLKVSGDCPVSPSRLDVLINAALNAGALGAKLSGSGGGGCMVALCLPKDLGKVSEAIKKAGGYPYITRITNKGLRLEFFKEQV